MLTAIRRLDLRAVNILTLSEYAVSAVTGNQVLPSEGSKSDFGTYQSPTWWHWEATNGHVCPNPQRERPGAKPSDAQRVTC